MAQAECWDRCDCCCACCVLSWWMGDLTFSVVLRCGVVCWFFLLASALCLWFASVAPVRGGTYFSLPPQRKVGKRKRLTPPTFLPA
ncbi:hypothetical protein PCAR4_1200030 [Paraburkholderia caribensis]|nr:hypothetical protein PCAR4_1200030 [Paraburkholderia caribensis]